MDVQVVAILPNGGWWEDSTVGAKLQNTLDGVANTARGLLNGVTSEWDTPVEFDISGSEDERDITTQSEIFRFVDEGTRPHPIWARRTRMLRMEAGYMSRTSPGNISRRGKGGSTGDNEYIFRRRVWHPGIQARHLTDRVQGMVQPLLESRVQSVLAAFGGEK